MLVNQEKLRRNLDETVERLAGDLAAGLIHAKVTASLVEDVTVESRFIQYGKPFAFTCDEAVERGGKGQSPSPLRYFLSGVAFCQGVWYAKGSAVVACRLDGLEIDLETFLDMRGEHRMGDSPAHPQWLVLEARVVSPSPPARVLAMVDEANARCPVWNLVKRAVPVYERIYHNGALLRDSVPEHLHTGQVSR